MKYGAVEGDHSFYINFGVFQKQEKRILVVNMCAGLLIDLVATRALRFKETKTFNEARTNVSTTVI